MKNFKRVVASVMATSMIASCAGMTTLVNLSASAEDYTVNIQHPSGDQFDEHTHTYGAYQIFAGEVKANDPNTLYNITWGSSLGEDQGVALAKELVGLYRNRKTNENRYINFKLFSDNKTLNDLYELDGKDNLSPDEQERLAAAIKNSAFAVADVLQATNAFHNNSLEMYKFAKVVKGYIQGEPTATSTTVTYSPGGNGTALLNPDAQLTLNAPGYYMFYDKDASVTGDEDVVSSTTAYLLKVVGDSSQPITIKAKVDKPTLDKNIIEDNKETKVNTASIGDTIHYKLTSKVPNMVGYNKFFFNISDTLDETLEFNYDSLSVYLIKGTDQATKVPLNKGSATDNVTNQSYYVNYNEYDGTNKQDIKIVFEDFIQYQGTWDEDNKAYDSTKVGYDIIVEYDAVLMENARIGDAYSDNDTLNEANVNKAQLIYSNDPNVVYNGYKDPNDPNNDRPDEPGNPEDEPTGETPESMVATFTTELKLTKVDENDEGLAGAEFEVKGSGVNIVVTYKKDYVFTEWGGTHYKLKDGTFTTQDPVGEAADNYESISQQYKLEENVMATVEHTDNDAGDQVINATVGEDGILRLTGLGEGTYTITETKAPDGYGKVNEPFTVNIEADVDKDSYKVTWKKGAGSSDDVTVDDNGLFQLTIQNFPGSVLPGTGGIGTVIFYVVGSLMMAGAAVLFVVKRKAEAKED